MTAPVEIVTHDGEVVIHPPMQFFAGDTWEIVALCTNADGSPMDLTGAFVEWKLNDQTGQATKFLTVTTVPTSGGSAISIDVPTSGDQPPTGACVITVKPQESNFAAGFYMDQLRVTTPAGVQSTQFQGRIEVVQRLK